MTAHPPQWHILGAGAIGSLWAALAHRAGNPPAMLLRDGHRLADYQRGKGIIFESGGQAEILPVQAQSPESMQSPIAQ
ncbi:MAG: 2-dehydropantoate 2-reductase N-terminal domain-containing protein, partial [Spongiibacter sp.]